MKITIELTLGNFCDPSNGSADNVLTAIIMVASNVTLVGWSEPMFAFMHAVGPAAAIYFVFQVLVLCVAVCCS